MTHPVFRHEAMATTFEIIVADRPEEYARQAAAAAFRELDRLEQELSRYIESSDIARANGLATGDNITIGEDAVQCLLIAAEISAATQQAFDPTYASVVAEGVRPDAPLFTLDPTAHTLTSHAARLHLDLGAVGKGYALDRLAETLRDWDVTSACLQSGGSTALALDPPAGEKGWAVGLGEGSTYRPVLITSAALSGSGIAVKGSHIIDPDTGTAATRSGRVWSLAPTAAVADALSTAFFVLPDSAIAAYCLAHPDVGAAVTEPSGRLICHGTLRSDGPH